MNASAKSRSRSVPLVQTLESRRLMSGSWTTVDSDSTSYDLVGMAADKVGNVYAIGTDNNNNANLRQETGGVWSTALTVADGGQTSFFAAAADPAGDVFIAGQGPLGGTIWERPAGQSALVVLDARSTDSFDVKGVATDSAGNVFVTGASRVTTTVKHQTTTTTSAFVRKFTPVGNGGFVASTSVLGTTMSVSGISVVESGAAAGVYAVGSNVFKSVDGGGTWSMVDGAPAYAVTGGAAGNVCIAGTSSVSVVTGYSRNGKPIYSTRTHWLVRQSGSGNIGSWSTVDDYLPTGDTNAYPAAMGADLAGNVYVAGSAYPATGVAHLIIRTNVGGSWSTSDDFTGRGSTWTFYSSFAVDSAGTLFAGGAYGDAAPPTFVRSMPGPAPTSASAGVFSSVAITAAPFQTSRVIDDLLGAAL